MAVKKAPVLPRHRAKKGEPKKEGRTIRLHPHEWDALDLAAEKSGRTLAGEVRFRLFLVSGVK